MVSADVCTGIVTYNPDIRLLRQNIESIREQTGQTVIYDNGSEKTELLEELVSHYEECVLIRGFENKGIAYALNRLCEWAESNHYKYMLTLDQDSISPNNLVDKLLHYSDNKVAIVSPNIIYKNNESFSTSSNKHYEEVEWVITSASLTNINVWRKLEGFDEWLFIDGVDYDFCIRARNEGFKVIRTFDVMLLHELGNLKCIKFFGKTIYVTNHVAWRKYYMSRNTIYLKHKLHKGKPFQTIFKYIMKALLFEDDKVEKMVCIIRGALDGIKSIHGF